MAAPPPGQAPPPQAPPPPGASPPPGAAPPGSGYYYPYYPPLQRAEEPPDRLPYRQGYLVPPGYHVETHVSKPLVITGSVLFGTTYLLSAAIGLNALDHENSKATPMLIPIAGPFITLGNVDFDNEFGQLAFIVVGLPLIFDGLAQTAGAITLIAGIGSTRQSLVRDGAAAQDTTPRLRFAGDRFLLEGRF
ncbi:hypothetical protein [Sorangium sp. So ce1182]|uniref:hypothetical protein n=1 Tax=Sorangium sp. So ce1182 TaxID=3133334 RepID=UPI003F63C608